MKRVISTILIAGSIVTAGMPAAAAAEQGRLKFSKVQTYAENQFSGISPTAWYYADVAGAYEYGFNVRAQAPINSIRMEKYPLHR